MENEICPVLVARVPAGVALTPDPAEVDDLEWVSWTDLRADVASGRRVISAWAHEQSLLLASLGGDPVARPQADRADLPPALRT